MDLKKELTKVNRQMERLSRKLAKLIIEADRLQKAKRIRKTAPKRTAGRKPTKLTAVDTVLKVMRRSKKPIEIPTLEKRTGFNKRKINNILYKLKNDGKVESVERGIYSLI